MFSDTALSSRIDNPDAYLDFYQYHWYPWQTQWMASPFTMTTAAYEVDDRPVIVGESEGNDVCDEDICQTLVDMYENAYLNGFDGVCAWKTPQNDGHGTFENIIAATNAFYDNYSELVHPEGSEPTHVTGITLSDHALSLESGTTYQLSSTLSPSDATDQRITWSSADSTIASISSNGRITAVSQGKTTITVTTSDGGFEDACTVEVTPGSGTGPLCSNPTPISLPHSQDGSGAYCWVTSDDISHINSWNTDKVNVNGIDLTNQWVGSALPDKIDGNYFIYYEGSLNWAHIEITGTSK
jgi:hypothetical protein